MANVNIPTGYIPNKPLKQIEQIFKKGGFGTVDQFVANNFTVDAGQLASIPVSGSGQSQLQSQSFQYLNDTGSGRISTGVLSLEAITKALKGVPIVSLTLFDQVIYTTPSVFYTTNQNDLRQAVYTNLGMAAFIPAASGFPTTIMQFNVVVDAMIKDIKNFTFTYDTYINTALVACKNVVRAALNYNGS